MSRYLRKGKNKPWRVASICQGYPWLMKIQRLQRSPRKPPKVPSDVALSPIASSLFYRNPIGRLHPSRSCLETPSTTNGSHSLTSSDALHDNQPLRNTMSDKSTCTNVKVSSKQTRSKVALHHSLQESGFDAIRAYPHTLVQ